MLLATRTSNTATSTRSHHLNRRRREKTRSLRILPLYPAITPSMIPRLAIACSLLALSLLLDAAGASAVHQLTLDNFEKLVDGKNVFIKFFAPWCGHCRAMAEDWERLAEEYKDHPVALIGEVDCTSDEGQPVCEDFDVQGFPTLVYGDPMSAETYDGPRVYESLAAWTKEHVSKPICSIYRVENCSKEDKALIESLEAKSDAELEAIVAAVEENVKTQEKAFDEKVVVIQKQYDSLVEEFNQQLDAIKVKYDYKFVEQILGIRQTEETPQEDVPDL